MQTVMTEAALSARLRAAMLGDAAAQAHFVKRGRGFSAGWIVRVGTTAHWIRCDQGRVVECRIGLPLMIDSRLSFNGSAAAWDEFWQPVPRAGWHDLLALSKRGELTFEGDMQLMLSNLQYLKDLLALPRTEVRT
jgi:hypothetical protein